VKSLPAKKQVHWVFPKDHGLNDTDYESDSDDSTFFDSFSSDSDIESEFFSPDTGETSLNYFFVEYFKNHQEQQLPKTLGFLCPEDWQNELKNHSLEVEDFVIKQKEEVKVN